MDHTILDQRLNEIPASIWQKIAQIDELKGQWIGGVKLGPQVLGRLKKSVLVSSTGASTRIEGAKLSDEDIEKLMRQRRDVEVGKEDFSVSTPDAMLDTVNSVLGGVQAFIIIIASMSILVGAVGIVNTMTTSVLERRKEIGIMKAIGAKNSQVFMQFFFESGMLGLIGGLVGIILGTLISVGGVMGINSFIGSDLLPTIDFILVGGALAGSFIVGAVAGIAPAMQAAKQNPVEALRG